MKKTNSLYKVFLEAKDRLKSKIRGKALMSRQVYVMSEEVEKDIDRILRLFINKGFNEIKKNLTVLVENELGKTFENSSFVGANVKITARKKANDENVLIFNFFVANSSGKGHYIWHIINAGRSGVSNNSDSNSKQIKNYAYKKAVSKAPAIFNPYAFNSIAPRTTKSTTRGFINPTSKRNARDSSRIFVYPKGDIMPSIRPREYYSTVVEAIEDFVKNYSKKSSIVKYKVKNYKINNRHNNKPGVRMEITWQ